jgi:glycosyltransferase involved in cell wall biosynthesis
VRVLAVSYFLPPSLYPQAIQVGRLLAHCPAEIGAVCGTQTGRPGLDLDFGLDKTLAFRLEVGFLPRLGGLAHQLARRFAPFYARVPDEFRSWVPLAETTIRGHLERTGFAPDVLVTFGEPMSDHLVGLRLKRQIGLRWIAHFSDPWIDNSFRRHEFLAQHVNARLESSVISEAGRVIFTSNETLDLVMRKYPLEWRTKAIVLPHSFDPALYPRPVRPTGPLTIRYLGNFYGHRSPVPLFRALKILLSRQPKVLEETRFELIGSMPSRMRRHSALKSLPEGLVRLRESVRYSESLKLMAASDLLLVIDGPDDLSVFLPSKLIDYLGAQVPILGIVPPGAAAKLLARLDAPVIDPRNPEQIASALQSMLGQAANRRHAASWLPWGKDSVASEFHVKNITATFSRIIQETARPN